MHWKDTSPVKGWLCGYLDEKARMESLMRVADELNGTAGRKTEAAQELNTVIRHIHETLLAREAMISRLEDARQRTVLTLRYIEGLRWNQITQALYYEAKTLYGIHRQALLEIQRMMETE